MHTSADSEWTLDLRQGKTPSVSEGPPADSPDLTLTINDDNFAKLVAGKLGQQQVCCTACRYSRLRNFDASLHISGITHGKHTPACDEHSFRHAGVPAKEAEDQGEHGAGNEAGARFPLLHATSMLPANLFCASVSMQHRENFVQLLEP